MIETNFYILSKEQYQIVKQDADELNLNVDYFLMEFCTVEGEYVSCD